MHYNTCSGNKVNNTVDLNHVFLCFLLSDKYLSFQPADLSFEESTLSDFDLSSGPLSDVNLAHDGARGSDLCQHFNINIPNSSQIDDKKTRNEKSEKGK